MNINIWYCIQCGGENSAEQMTCFACQSSRSLLPESSALLYDRYQLHTQIGTGGFSNVYRATDTQAAGRLVAIKQINLRGLNTSQIIEATDSFHREVALLSTLSNPHLPKIHDHFTDRDHWYLVLDFIEGETLERYLADQADARFSPLVPLHPLLPIDEILDIAGQLCDVLTYLHSWQPAIIFRDLKPANLMRTPQGHIFLIDFGIARYFKPAQLRDTIPFGSPGYAAPEQYGKAQTTPRSDIYSLGALLHYLLSGSDPSLSPFRFAPLRLEYTTKSDLSALEALVTRMVSLEAQQRPGDLTELKKTVRPLYALPPLDLYASDQSFPHASPVSGQTAYSAGSMQAQVHMSPPTGLNNLPRRSFLKTGLAIGVAATAAAGGLGGIDYLFSQASAFHRRDHMSRSYGMSDNVVPFSDTQFQAAWSADGSRVAMALAWEQITILDVATQVSWVYHLEHGSKLVTMAWSPMGNNALAFVCQSHNTGDATTFRSIQVLKMSSQTYALVESRAEPYLSVKYLSWSPDGQYLALNDGEPTITLWLLSANGMDMSIEALAPSFLAWSPTQPLLAVGETSGLIRIFYTDSGKLHSIYNGHSAIAIINRQNHLDNKSGLRSITSISWSPDGLLIASGDLNAQTQVWNVQTGQQYLAVAGVGSVAQVAWSPNGQLIAIHEATISSIYRVIDKSLVWQKEGPSMAFMAWDADNKHILVASFDEDEDKRYIIQHWDG